MSEKFIDRLSYFMSEIGINDNQMTVKANLSVGLIGRCRKERKGMASDSIEKILYAYPELSAEWLLRGEGEMLRTNQGAQTNTMAQVSPVNVENVQAVFITNWKDIQGVVEDTIKNVLIK